MYIRKANERGRENFGWLQSQHSFSFGHYYDPAHMGWGNLRVINDDEVAPGAGFDTHGHRNMEIISYILSGSIAHKDSVGNEFIIPAGDVQRMSAGSGITHSEYNASKSEPLKFLQIWIKPNVQEIEPGYEQKAINQDQALTLLVSPDSRDGSLSMHADAAISRLELKAGESITLDAPQKGYLHIVSGSLTANGENLGAGDAVGIESSNLEVNAQEQVHALWFDL